MFFNCFLAGWDRVVWYPNRRQCASRPLFLWSQDVYESGIWIVLWHCRLSQSLSFEIEKLSLCISQCPLSKFVWGWDQMGVVTLGNFKYGWFAAGFDLVEGREMGVIRVHGNHYATRQCKSESNLSYSVHITVSHHSTFYNVDIRVEPAAHNQNFILFSSMLSAGANSSSNNLPDGLNEHSFANNSFNFSICLSFHSK